MTKVPVFIALDVDTKDQSLALVKKTCDLALGYKVGPRFFLKHPDIIKEIKSIDSSSEIFLDFKFYDIPTSTLEAVKTVYELGADLVTVHAEVGLETLRALADFEKSCEAKFKVLAVTVLSSVASENASGKVEELTDLVVKSGLNSVVCSGLEASALRKKYKDLYLVTPGIRLKGDSLGDQKRVMTPDEAFAAGSSCLVMGRSLTKASEPLAILKSIKKD